MVVFIIILVFFALIALWYISAGNRFRRMLVKVDESESGIDVALTKRFDMLTKLLDACKVYASYENETFAKIIELRKGMSMAERTEAVRQMDAVSGQLSVLAEAYPELKSSENFRELQIGIRDAEGQLQAARRLYNSNVSAFNQSFVTFPASLVANKMKMTKREFFEADEKKRDDIQIKL